MHTQWATEPVLNAFRHHGKWDRARLAKPVAEHRIVLNAFRHHGKWDWRRKP